MKIKTIKRARRLEGKRVLVRVDYNLPIKRGKILDNTRLVASLSTINYLREKKARIILVTHIGRPEGKIKSSLKVDPILEELASLLKVKKIRKLETKNWKLSDKKKLEVLEQVEMIRPGEVALMENIRFSPDEKKDTGKLSQELANMADIFVLDGFAVAHRASASVVGVANHIPSYGGLLIEQEIKGLNKVLDKPKKPFVMIVGGAKIATKIPVIENMLPKADKILLGGGLFNTCLKARGYKVGSSLVDMKYKDHAISCGKKRKILFPVDVIVGTPDGKNYRPVDIEKDPHTICKRGEAIFDIGPKTVGKYAVEIKKAQTLVWNGAMGYFEQKPYDVGTMAIARLVASRSKGKAYGVIGGGETLQSMEMVDMMEFVDMISTGGGAMLEFLSGSKLPGLEILK